MALEKLENVCYALTLAGLVTITGGAICQSGSVIYSTMLNRNKDTISESQYHFRKSVANRGVDYGTAAAIGGILLFLPSHMIGSLIGNGRRKPAV